MRGQYERGLGCGVGWGDVSGIFGEYVLAFFFLVMLRCCMIKTCVCTYLKMLERILDEYHDCSAFLA